MLDLILIIMLIVSISKPEILVSKKVKEKANDEQFIKIVRNTRKSYACIIAMLEGLAICRLLEENILLLLALTVIAGILIVKVVIPASKETKGIMQEIGLK